MGGECKYVCAKEVGCLKGIITREGWLALHSAALVLSPPRSLIFFYRTMRSKYYPVLITLFP